MMEQIRLHALRTNRVMTTEVLEMGPRIPTHNTFIDMEACSSSNTELHGAHDGFNNDLR